MSEKKDPHTNILGSTFSHESTEWVVPLDKRTRGLGAISGKPSEKKLTGPLGNNNTTDNDDKPCGPYCLG